MKENIFKMAFAAAGTALTIYFKSMIIPIVILFAVMIIDYVTGMIKASFLKELNSRIGIVGIVKKLCYLLVVAVGMGIDWILCTGLEQIGITYQITFAFGIIVIIWLVINEMISILENLAKIGVPMPKFLTAIINKLKIVVEEKAEKKEAK